MMDMNRAFFARAERYTPQWRVVDAKGEIVGRIATKIATMLRGKDKPSFTPHANVSDYIVVINAEHVVFTGNKMEHKSYEWYTGWIGNRKTRTAREIMAKDSTEVLRHAIHGMLPKNKLMRQLHRKLRIYAGSEHPHTAQVARKTVQ